MWSFAAEHPIVFLLLVIIAAASLRRICRFAVVALRGWPPGPVDADGDAIVVEIDDDDADLIAARIIERLEARQRLARR